MKEVDEDNKIIKEQGFRIIGNVLENWELINYQMLSKENVLLLNLTVNIDNSEGKMHVEFLQVFINTIEN